MDKINLMNQIVADSQVLYVKLHNYHWNIKGIHFFAIHQKTEMLYQHMSIVYDDVAERIIQLGGKPLVTLADILKISKIQEESKTDYDVQYIINSIVKDFKHLLASFVELSHLSASSDDNTTMAYADEQSAFLEKEIWMLQASIG